MRQLCTRIAYCLCAHLFSPTYVKRPIIPAKDIWYLYHVKNYIVFQIPGRWHTSTSYFTKQNICFLFTSLTTNFFTISNAKIISLIFQNNLKIMFLNQQRKKYFILALIVRKNAKQRRSNMFLPNFCNLGGLIYNIILMFLFDNINFLKLIQLKSSTEANFRKFWLFLQFCCKSDWN